MKPYEHKSIEEKWQARWEEERAFVTPQLSEGEKGSYILDMFPYPSGSGLHVGHLLGYTGSDIIARTARMQGKKVLHPMGWDSFGLPAENYALKTGIHPAVSTLENTKEYKRQFRQTGISFDWDKELMTSDPGFYKWTQWLFTFLYEQGLAYRKEGMVNWCPKDQTVLANEQVVSGKCERCGSEVEQKNLKQWYFKITEFADELLAGLDTIDWPEKIKLMQRNWIGKSEGAQIFFMTEGGERVEVFTTRPDTLFGATYLVLAPEHSLVDVLTTEDQRSKVQDYREATKKKSELERLHLEKHKTGVWTGSFALHPLTGEKLPIWIADYVLSTYGTGAIMAVPAHDQRDYDFAKEYSLPVTTVIEPVTGTEAPDEEFRRSIVAILEDENGALLSINWGEKLGGHLFIGGGIDEGEDIIEAAMREIAEETGYFNLDLVSQTETIHHHYRAHSKNINRYIQAFGLHFKLRNTEQHEVHLEEDEKGKFTLEWITAEEAGQKIADPLHFLVYKRLIKGEIYSEAGILTNSGEFNGKTSTEATQEIARVLSEKQAGRLTTTYRLRDWLVSRQRYWGAPIPVVYDEAGNEHVLPVDQLPVELPTDVAFSPTGQSPLVSATDWKQVEQDGRHFTREVDTLDTFVCSSWYFLRFPNPGFSEGPFDPDLLKKWLPVDVYMGGAEHAVLHLLYARFITKALHRAGLVSFDEPFLKLRNQGSILGPDHQKMSKSKGNVVNPDDVINEHGADTLRAYEMFMAPFELEKPWSTTGIIGVRRFLEKVWRLQERATEPEPTTEESEIIHTAIKRVTEDIEAFKFNTCVSTLMETTNSLLELGSISLSTYRSLLLLLSPFAPHITEELWETMGNQGFCSLAAWPKFNPEYTSAQTWNCPVQINGKTKATLTVSKGLSKEDLEAQVLASAEVQKFLEGKNINKIIVVPDRIVSIVTS